MNVCKPQCVRQENNFHFSCSRNYKLILGTEIQTQKIFRNFFQIYEGIPEIQTNEISLVPIIASN